MQWHPIDALPAFQKANAGKRVSYLFYWPAITGCRHSSNNRAEAVMDYQAARRPATKFCVIAFPEPETVNGE